MKKENKKILIALFVVLIMFSSSIAFIILGNPVSEQESGYNITFINKKIIPEHIKNYYLSRGFTLLEFHYAQGCCEDMVAFIENLPQELDYQIIVQIVPNSNTTPLIHAESMFGAKNKTINSTTQIIPLLCDLLIKPPLECGVLAETE